MDSTEETLGAVRAERVRIARELHDTIGQALYGIALGAQAAAGYLESDPSRVADALDYIRTSAERARVELRALLFDLRPDALESEGLRGALTKWAGVLRVRYGLEARVDLDDEPEAPPPVKEAVYAVVREATTNVVKHARAGQVVLSLTAGSDLIVTIADDGIGFDPRGVFAGHYGMTGMRERLAVHGGRLEIVSDPGRGTRVRAIVPLAQNPGARSQESKGDTPDTAPG